MGFNPAKVSPVEPLSSHPWGEDPAATQAFFSSQAEQHERGGRLTDETIKALSDANLFGLLTPTAVGGLEVGATEALEELESISKAEAATGWVLTTCSLAAGLAGAYLSDDAVAQIFAKGVPIIAGAGAPMGRAKVVDGGYSLSGRWSYGSGIRHAAYTHNGSLIVDRDGTLRTDLGHHIIVAPIQGASLSDQWDVLGLRGTGSVDYEIRDQFVPNGFEHPTAAPQAKRGGSLYGIGMGGLVTIAHTGFFLGIGRRALDELILVAKAKAGAPGSLTESESFQEGYGMAEAKYRAARAFVFETWSEAERQAKTKGALEPGHLALLQMAMHHMAWASTEAAEYAYKTAGGVSLRAGPLQRAFRDCFAGRQHVRVSNLVLRTASKELLNHASL